MANMENFYNNLIITNLQVKLLLTKSNPEGWNFTIGTIIALINMVRNPLNTYDPLLDKASQAQRGDQEKLQDKKSNKSLQTELHHLVLE